jgi:hypothetical protein
MFDRSIRRDSALLGPQGPLPDLGKFLVAELARLPLPSPLLPQPPPVQPATMQRSGSL